MLTVTESWLLPVNIGVILLFLLLILLGAKKGFLLMIISLAGSAASFFGAWFLADIFADYIRLWPRKWALLQDTPMAGAAWQFMNQICWFLTLFVVFRIIFGFITMICRGLQEVPILGPLNAALGGILGIFESMIFILVFTIALNSPLFTNGSIAAEQTVVAKVNELSGIVYEKLLEPVMDADAFSQAYDDAAKLTNEQRDKLRQWLEDRGYSADIDGITVIPEESSTEEEGS